MCLSVGVFDFSLCRSDTQRAGCKVRRVSSRPCPLSLLEYKEKLQYLGISTKSDKRSSTASIQSYERDTHYNMHNILLTGASGYLGGTLLARLHTFNLPPYSTLYCLVRTPAQADAVRQYSAEPLTLDLSSPSAIEESILDHNISIIFYLIDAFGPQVAPFIRGLSTVKGKTNQDVHFLFTTGAKLFSGHAGAPTDRALLDTDPDLYSIQKDQKPVHAILRSAVDANCTVVEAAENYGVKSYVFAPCIVYGPGEGFGNKISIQTVAIVQAAKAAGRVLKVDEGKPTWPVSHVLDTVGLYAEILRGILEGKDVGSGKGGYFLAASGSVAWDDLYAAMAQVLWKRGAIKEKEVSMAREEDLEAMGKEIGCPKEFVHVQVGGL